MAAVAWRIGTDTPSYTAEDLSGKGAEKTGGRWNREGQAVIYAAGSIALACLETLVHVDQDGLPLNRFLVRIEIPPEVWAARQEVSARQLPVGWEAVPAGMVSLDYGDAWLQSAASPLLIVPSVIVPEEHNVLLNPRHPLAKGVRATKVRQWRYDPRLFMQ